MVETGSSAAISTSVRDEDTAISLRSGDVRALGTPRVVALCEEAAVTAIADSLPAGATSVGTSISIEHMAASGVGATVTATAVVTDVEEGRVEFDVELTEGDKIAAAGTHVRFVVDRARFEHSVVASS
jgi:fluoroacetyl-CoA thioesterase